VWLSADNTIVVIRDTVTVNEPILARIYVVNLTVNIKVTRSATPKITLLPS
jgi:hypothetical protein